MEIDSQRMEALKKAYADIILNTAKDAAARIMVSERKALRFQQDLSSAKDEALFMIVRLKQMMDSKITEAEIKALSQRRKIEELEAQLYEAEQIIIDLRFELKEVQDGLEKGKKMQPLNGQNLKVDVSSYVHKAHNLELNASDPITFSPLNSRPTITTDDMKITPLLQEMPNSCDTKHLVPLSDSHMKNNWLDNTELSSIIMRSKMPEQCRNGCTQRIHSFETTLLDGKLTPTRHLNDQVSPMNNISMIRDDEKGEEACTLTSLKAESVDMMKEPGPDKLMQLNSRICEIPLVKVIRRQKRKIRYGKAKKTSCRSRSHQIIKPCQPSSLPHCNSYSNAVNHKPVGYCSAPSLSVDLTKSYRNEEIMQHDNKDYEDQAVEIIPRGYRKRKIKYRNTLATSFRSPPCHLAENYPSLLSRCKRTSNSVNGDVKSGEDTLEMTENGDKTKSDLAVDKSGILQIASELEKSELVKHIFESSEGSRFPCTTKIKMVDVPLANSNLEDAKASEANNETSSQADSDRILKYTFQRKRKKVSLSNPDETTSLENSSTKRRAGERQTGAPEPLKSSLIEDSSRDSRRLVQVARQLISLSAKKWWQ